jgi:uncharacterized protein
MSDLRRFGEGDRHIFRPSKCEGDSPIFVLPSFTGCPKSGQSPGRKMSQSPAGLDRRTFLKTAAIVTGANVLAPLAAPAAESAEPRRLIDVNVSLSHWPSRRLPCDEPAALVARLRRGGVTQAWAGTFDALLCQNINAVNDRLAQQCRTNGGGLLIPFGSINPLLPGWEDELQRCAQQHHMPGIRLHPNYHGYKLDHPALAQLLSMAARRGLIVQLALCMEDERNAQRMLSVPPVDPAPLARLVKKKAGLRLMLLNAKSPLGVAPLMGLPGAAELYLEIAMLEGVAGLETLLRRVPPSRVCFGSHAPFFSFESARLKLKESILSDQQLQAICTANAERLLRVTTL